MPLTKSNRTYWMALEEFSDLLVMSLVEFCKKRLIHELSLCTGIYSDGFLLLLNEKSVYAPEAHYTGGSLTGCSSACL